MKITVATGAVAFWQDSTKGTSIPLTNGAFYVDGGDLPKTVWVEATAVSTSVRDILLRVGYEPPGGTLVDDLDRVTATAIWVTPSQLLTTGTSLPADADGQTINTRFQIDLGGHFGPTLNPGSGILDLGIGIEFLIRPSLIGLEPAVNFDITRQRESVAFAYDGTWFGSPLFAFSLGDIPNDDAGNLEEDSQPTNDHIYSIDNPGLSYSAGGSTRIVKRGNFREFVRVLFGGKKFVNRDGLLEGSRCSQVQLWKARGDLSKVSGTWRLTAPPAENTVGAGNQTLGTHP
jgi:hypothetical protein